MGEEEFVLNHSARDNSKHHHSTVNTMAGYTRCLGWCGKTFWSPDKTCVRFCQKCKGKRNSMSDTMSRMEMRKIGIEKSGTYE